MMNRQMSKAMENVAKRRASERTMIGTCTTLLTVPVQGSLNQAPSEGSVLDDDGGTTLTSPKKAVVA
eukprot:9817366-Prorocentrum_lima.AAC.1